MEVKLTGTAEEIAALVLQLQGPAGRAAVFCWDRAENQPPARDLKIGSKSRSAEE